MIFRNKDKSPMTFCLRPCGIKAQVKNEITKGGGLCFSNQAKVPIEYREKTITLLPEGEVSWNINTISARYIIDCSKEGKLLPKDHYACLPIREEPDISKGRKEYSRKEDINILLYVRDNAGTDKLNGNTFWKKLEKLNMFQLHGRSWHSLRDRYLKHLKGREDEYPLGGRDIGPLPMPPEAKKKTPPKVHRPLDLPTESSPKKGDLPGSFLARVESKRNDLSPGLTRKSYDVLIGDFETTMQKKTGLDSKSILKALYKCNGDESIAKFYLINGKWPEGYHAFTDQEDEVLLKCLLNPTTCDETPAKRLADELGEQIVLRRAAALLGVTRNDYNYMKNIPLWSANTDTD